MRAPSGAATLTDEQRLAWLRLIRSDNIGPVTFRELVNHFGSAADALAAVPDLARNGGKAIRLASVADAEREFAAAETAPADAHPPGAAGRGSRAGGRRGHFSRCR